LSTDELTKAQFEQVIEGFLEHFSGDLVPTEILKHVVRHDAAIRTRCEKAERGQDQIDLYRDEFMRIKALNVNGEVNGICDRAVKDIERRVSVISELESTLELLAKANQSYEDIRLNRDNVITQAIARESLLIRKLHEKDRQLGLLEQQLCNFQEEIDSLRGDARRYRWLCDDHSSAQVREKRKDLLKGMSVMSYSAISTDIDAAIEMLEGLQKARNCPKCGSSGRHLHPAMQHEGEVQICRDSWHAEGHVSTNQSGS